MNNALDSLEAALKASNRTSTIYNLAAVIITLWIVVFFGGLFVGILSI